MLRLKGFIYAALLVLALTSSSYAFDKSQDARELEASVAEIEGERGLIDNQDVDELEPMQLDLEEHGETFEVEGRNLRSSYSNGVYAIPYEPGVSVRVNRDHLTHTPVNRIDMSGKSGGPYKIVAAAAGTVKFVQDSYNVNGGCANNNYVWIAHSNGEWTKYSHLAHDSASVDAGLSVGDKVKVGEFIGIEDDIGCASGDHLHWEVGVPDDLSDPIVHSGGYIKGKNLIPRICGIQNNIYVAGTTYVVPHVRPGWGEYARHGLAHNKFQADFLAASRCGYRMDWNDGYGKGNTAYFNVVYHPNKTPFTEVGEITRGRQPREVQLLKIAW